MVRLLEACKSSRYEKIKLNPGLKGKNVLCKEIIGTTDKIGIWTIKY